MLLNSKPELLSYVQFCNLCVCIHYVVCTALTGPHMKPFLCFVIIYKNVFHRVCFLMRLFPALHFFSLYMFFFLQYIHSFRSHAEPCGEGSSCQRGQQAARFVRIIMPGERVVWIPPERLCTGTKEWKRSSVILEIRVGVGVTWVKWSLKRLHF